MAPPQGILEALRLPKPKPGAAAGPLPPAAVQAAPPAAKLPPGFVPTKPFDPLDPADLRRVLGPAAPRAGGSIDDDALAKALKGLPADPVKRVQALTDLVPRIGDAARRDPVVRALRGALAKVTPFATDGEAKKQIDDAIDALVEKGIKKAILELLKAAVGKEPTEVDRDAPPRYGPALKEPDFGQTIVKGPEITLPFDKPKPVRRNSFEFRGLSGRYRPSKAFDIKVLTPDWFEPYGQLGAGRVIVASKDDYDKSGRRPTPLSDQRIETKGEVKIGLAAPDEPGTYVLYISLGSEPQRHPVETFEVAR